MLFISLNYIVKPFLFVLLETNDYHLLPNLYERKYFFEIEINGLVL